MLVYLKISIYNGIQYMHGIVTTRRNVRKDCEH